MRQNWEIVAAVELQQTIDHLVDGGYKTVQELAQSLKNSQKQWESIADRDNVEVSGLTFPLVEHLSDPDKPDKP